MTAGSEDGLISGAGTAGIGGRTWLIGMARCQMRLDWKAAAGILDPIAIPVGRG
jgi:hypothetical protein